MRKSVWILLTAMAASSALVACGGDGGGETGAGGGGGGGGDEGGGPPTTTTGTTTTGTTTTGTTTGTTTTGPTTTTGTGNTVQCSPPPSPAPSGGSCSASNATAAATKCGKEYDIGAGFFVPGACEECIETKCCTQIDACAADANCDACLSGTGGETECNAAESLLNALVECAVAEGDAGCVAGGECGSPRIECNAVTNEGCAAGEACDLVLDQDSQGNLILLGLACAAGDNSAAACEACDFQNGPLCAGGATCLGSEETACLPFCCADGDCGGGATCGQLTTGGSFTLGVCGLE